MGMPRPFSCGPSLTGVGQSVEWGSSGGVWQLILLSATVEKHREWHKRRVERGLDY